METLTYTKLMLFITSISSETKNSARKTLGFGLGAITARVIVLLGTRAF
jgi:hypothetical protein